MPRNYRTLIERNLSDIANGYTRHRTEREKADAIRKLAEDDPRVRKALKRGARASGLGLTFDPDYVSAADKAYKGRVNEQARERGAAKPKEKTPAEIAEAQAKAAHEEAVRKTADERSALKLPEEKFYARFVKPLVEDVAQRMGGDDADAKAAYVSGVERHALQSTQGKLGTAIHYVQSMGDEKLKFEIAYYIERHKENLLQSRLIHDVIDPAVTRAAERAAKEGLFEDAQAAKQSIPHYPFSSGMSHEPLAGANASERRFGSYRHSITHLVKQADYRGYVRDVAEAVTKDTDAFEAKLMAGFKSRHEHVGAAEKVQALVKDELREVVEQGRFPASEKAQQAALRILTSTDAGSALAAANAVRYSTKINVYGSVTVDEGKLKTVQDALTDPEKTRATVRAQFEEQGAQIMRVASLAQAFVAADAHRQNGLDQQALLTSRIADTHENIKDGTLGVLERLKSVYGLFALKRERSGVAAQFEGSIESASEVRKAFDTSRETVVEYFAREEINTPESFVAATQDLRAPAPAV